jgi:hypothetical protein
LMTHFRVGEFYYYSGDLEKSRVIFTQIEYPRRLKTSALFYLGMIAAQNKNTKDIQKMIEQLQILSMELFEEDLRYASIYFGIGNEKEGFKHLDNFFSKPITQKLKYAYNINIALDNNFSNYIKTIRKKYFE